MRPSIYILAIILILSMSIVAFWFGIEGLITGETLVATRFGSSGAIVETISPDKFRFAIYLHFFCGIGLLLVSIYSIFDLKRQMQKKKNHNE